MSNWAYVAIAYTAVWGALAMYALFLARRVSQARAVEEQLRGGTGPAKVIEEQETIVCDAPPGH